MTTGRQRFIESVGRLRRERLPATDRKYRDEVPEGFRKLLARQAGVPDAPLDELTELQREKLFQAAVKVRQIAERSERVLLGVVIPKV